MTTLDLAIIQAIDVAVAKRLEQEPIRLIAKGEVASITDQDNGMVTFDGSIMAVPVKLAGDADFMPGDRVVMVKSDPRWWVAIAPLTRRWSTFAHAQTQQTLGGSTTSGTYNDVPNPADVTLVKRWGGTGFYAQVSAGSYCSAVACEAHFGVQVTDSSGNVTTTFVVNAPYSQASDRISVTDSIVIPGMAADTYTCRVVWRRQTGPGTVQTDLSEFISLTVAEVSP